MKKLFCIFALCLSLPVIAIAADQPKLKKMQWPFEGFLGTFDRAAAQRGFQVYKEVCSSCHALEKISYRNLKEIGITDPEIKEIAKQYTVRDGPNDEGEMFDRPALPSDRFVKPFKNEQAARAANGGVYPLDLSLIIKARHDGANYLYSLLTGYENPPEGFKMMEGLHYNVAFSGHQIAMPKPLSDGQVVFADGTKDTVEQMSRDVVIFLQWAAEPEMEHRKSMGLKVMIYLGMFTILFYIAKKRIWAKLKH